MWSEEAGGKMKLLHFVAQHQTFIQDQLRNNEICLTWKKNNVHMKITNAFRCLT